MTPEYIHPERAPEQSPQVQEAYQRLAEYVLRSGVHEVLADHAEQAEVHTFVVTQPSLASEGVDKLVFYPEAKLYATKDSRLVTIPAAPHLDVVFATPGTDRVRVEKTLIVRQVSKNTPALASVSTELVVAPRVAVNEADADVDNITARLAAGVAEADLPSGMRDALEARAIELEYQKIPLEQDIAMLQLLAEQLAKHE